MYLTWIAIIASLLMGIGSSLIPIFPAEKDSFCYIKKPQGTFPVLALPAYVGDQPLPQESVDWRPAV